MCSHGNKCIVLITHVYVFNLKIYFLAKNQDNGERIVDEMCVLPKDQCRNFYKKVHHCLAVHDIKCYYWNFNHGNGTISWPYSVMQ